MHNPTTRKYYKFTFVSQSDEFDLKLPLAHQTIVTFKPRSR
jgi:hypothetical protein